MSQEFQIPRNRLSGIIYCKFEITYPDDAKEITAVYSKQQKKPKPPKYATIPIEHSIIYEIEKQYFYEFAIIPCLCMHRNSKIFLRWDDATFICFGTEENPLETQMIYKAYEEKIQQEYEEFEERYIKKTSLADMEKRIRENPLFQNAL
jgi:hypothetical protein